MEEFMRNFEAKHKVEVLRDESLYWDPDKSVYVWNPLVVQVDVPQLRSFVGRWGRSGKFGPVSYLVNGKGKIEFRGGYGKDMDPML
ncbi:hypothetical protein AWM70_14860 [Paenibacillus yonginensis]|uniref:Uncharacterized protein n=2 Tax=Paenibacillus TaxID=44249 RepID=A0A1B1N2S2_9BACL|nr:MULTISPECIES: hypothetical protein [Paenibacillus]ANS75720.1 hypothetical protein AWM70_14860 [Paenibacillus yonginensis]GGA48219.1 hypothetical protein GCM10010917_36850 [Paenibacillus physcomitrellae]